jgi:cytidylate kinase
MALITVSGQPGSRHEEVARLVAHLLDFELVTEARLRGFIDQEFEGENSVPDKAFAPAVVSVVARLAAEHHLVVAAEGVETLFRDFPGLLRVQVVAPESRRVGSLMLENRLDRPSALKLLRNLEAQQREYRKRRFGLAQSPAHTFDVVCNTETLDVEQIAELVRGLAESRLLREQGLLSHAAEAHIEFQARLKLSKFGIQPRGKATLNKPPFMHPSEEVFANLLDFYRVAWEYEPRSFTIRADKDGSVLEAFTPDFYLPEFDLYVELTTMKQSLVTRKNRKVKLLRALYPNINIQVFYQKDFENLVFKYGLTERLAKV